MELAWRSLEWTFLRPQTGTDLFDCQRVFRSILNTAAAYVKISGVIAVNCTIMCCAGLQGRLAQEKTVIPFDRRKRNLSRAFPFETWFDLNTS